MVNSLTVIHIEHLVFFVAAKSDWLRQDTLMLISYADSSLSFFFNTKSPREFSKELQSPVPGKTEAKLDTPQGAILPVLGYLGEQN